MVGRYDFLIKKPRKTSNQTLQQICSFFSLAQIYFKHYSIKNAIQDHTSTLFSGPSVFSDSSHSMHPTHYWNTTHQDFMVTSKRV